MATAVSGKPAIIDPPVLDLATLRQRIANIRERFALLEAAVNRLGAIADGSKFANDIALLQKQMVGLLNQINTLTVQLAAAIEPADNEGQVAAQAAELAELRKAADNQQAPPGVTMADFAELVKRVQGLEEGVVA